MGTECRWNFLVRVGHCEGGKIRESWKNKDPTKIKKEWLLDRDNGRNSKGLPKAPIAKINRREHEKGP